MPRPGLDSIDRRLLRLLQKDNRRSLRDLAVAVGVSAPTCMRRVRRLEETGVIRAHMAVLDAKKLGMGTVAFVEVVLVAPSGAAIQNFERRMQRCPEVAVCAEVAGDVDYLLLVRTAGMEEFSDFTRRQLASDRSIESFRSFLILRQSKNELEVPV
jgi:Lrp/AsnC family transcriptional regulator, leucine-responsive regulatory protein